MSAALSRAGDATISVLIGDAATDRAIRDLAELTGTSLDEAVRDAVEQELVRERARRGLAERIAPWQERYAALVQPGVEPADKAFYDSLSGQG
jgi:hypothetical protein